MVEKEAQERREDQIANSSVATVAEGKEGKEGKKDAVPGCRHREPWLPHHER